MRLIDADRALEIVRDQGIAHPNAYHLTNYATLILREAPTITDLSKCIAFNSAADDKPHTNADRIRGMTDEELAWELMLWRCEAVARHHGISSEYPDTQKTILEWLKQPPKGE